MTDPVHIDNGSVVARDQQTAANQLDVVHIIARIYFVYRRQHVQVDYADVLVVSVAHENLVTEAFDERRPVLLEVESHGVHQWTELYKILVKHLHV